MSERVNSKRIKINGRNFEIEKMDALESVAVLKELLSRALPIDLLSIFGDSVKTIAGSVSKRDMTIEEFVELEKRILRYSYEVLPTGLTRVIDNGGNFGVNDLEKDIDSILKLLFEAIRLNYESFFVENLQRMGVLEKIMPQDNL